MFSLEIKHDLLIILRSQFAWIIFEGSPPMKLYIFQNLKLVATCQHLKYRHDMSIKTYQIRAFTIP